LNIWQRTKKQRKRIVLWSFYCNSDLAYICFFRGEDSQTDAATYSKMVKHDPDLTPPLIIVSGLTHKGSTLVGIIRTQNPVSEDFSKRIATDTQAILNWWA